MHDQTPHTTNFSASAHPNLNTKGWFTLPWPQGTLQEPKTTQNSFRKTTCFLGLFSSDEDQVANLPNPHTNYFFRVCPPHSQPPGWVTHQWLKGSHQNQKRTQNISKKPFSWACFQAIKIQLYILQIHTKTNFSASSHPILNPWGWVTNPWPQGTPPEPKHHTKYLQRMMCQKFWHILWFSNIQGSIIAGFYYQLSPTPCTYIMNIRGMIMCMIIRRLCG